MKQTILLILATIIEIALIAAIVYWQGVGTEYYSENIYPIIAKISTFMTGWFSFSLGDILILLLVIGLLSLPFTPGVKAWQKLWYLALSIGFIYVWFYMSWGMNYFRDNIYTRTNKEIRQYSDEELETYTSQFIETLNFFYSKAKVDTTYKQDIIVAINNLDSTFNLTTISLGSEKSMISNKLMEKVGVSGYFNPFFGEYHIRASLFDVAKPFTFAHEAAHKASVSSEDEANFIAFLACKNSKNDYAILSGYYVITRYLLYSAFAVLPQEKAEKLRDKVNPEILALYKEEAEYYSSLYSENLGSVQSWVYDRFLKSNNVKSGKKSYSEVVGLMLNFSDFALMQNR